MQITTMQWLSIEMPGSLSSEWSVLVASEWWKGNRVERIETMDEWTDGKWIQSYTASKEVN